MKKCMDRIQKRDFYEVIRLNPKVSVIIPVFNGSNYLKKAIESVLNQTYANIEIIVVNDGSQDNGETEKIALSFGKSIQYYFKENGGVASALNLGIRKMTGEYFSWLSHDDYFEPDKIEKQIKRIEELGDPLTVVYGNYYIEDMSQPEKSTIFHDEIYDTDILENGIFPVYLGLVAGGTVLFNRKHFEIIGKFREDLITVQDYDFWFRLFHNSNISFINEPLMTIRWHEKQGSKTLKQYTKEREWLYQNFLLLTEPKVWTQLHKNGIILVLLRKFLEWRLKDTFWAFVNIIEAVLENDGTEDAIKLLDEKEVYIFGAGKIGKSLAFLLQALGYKIEGFLDNDSRKENLLIGGVKCRTLCALNNRDVCIVVSMKGNIQIVMNQLEREGFYRTVSWETLERKCVNSNYNMKDLIHYIKGNKEQIELLFE